MKQTSLQIHPVFPPAGEQLPQLVLDAFSLSLRQMLAEGDGAEEALSKFSPPRGAVCT